METKNLDMKKAISQKKCFWLKGKKCFDINNKAIDKNFVIKDIVLYTNLLSKIDISKAQKFVYCWFGLFQIYKSFYNTGYYYLQEMDGIPIAGLYSNN